MNPIFPVEHLVLMLLAVVALGTFLAWRTTSKCRSRIRVIAALARLLGLLCVSMLALNPGRWKREREDIDNEWAILVDRSMSMATADVDGQSRWAEARRLAAGLRSAAADPNSVRLYTFIDNAVPAGIADLEELAPGAGNTDIVAAGKSALARSRSGGKRLTGMVLISDGRHIPTARHNDLGIRAQSQGTAIFPLPLGGEVPPRDLLVKSTRRQHVAFVGQKTRLRATVAARGLGQVSPTIRLLDTTGAEVASRKLDIPADDQAEAAFEIVPSAEGYYEYVFSVPPWEDERTIENNTARFGVLVLAGKMKVFMAEGTPHWDSKFVAQLLRKQPNMELTSVYRLSSDRFFRVETDASRVSHASEAIFPDTPDEINAYDLVLFGKGTEYFLTPERVALLKSFVKERGACVVFFRGKPYKGEFRELSQLEPIAWGTPVGSKFKLKPTRTGQEVGLFDAMLAGVSDPVWLKLPPLRYAHRTARLKSFSQVLVEGMLPVAGKEIPLPVVVARRYGKGIVLVVNAEGLWQWDFFPSVTGADTMYKEFWTQLMQWAATYAEFLPGHEYALSLSDTSVLPETPVRVRVNRRGADGPEQPPLVRVIRGKNTVQELTVSSAGGTAWETVFTMRDPGTYRLELAGPESPPCATLHVKAPPTERDETSANPEFLRQLAEISGGAVIAEQDIANTVAALEPPPEAVDMNRAVWVPLWDRWWLLCGMLSFFGIEWFTRRRNGLM